MFYIFLLLCLSFASTRCRDIRAIEDEPGYYCRYNNEFQICLRFPDEEKSITLTKTDCTCDNITIKNKAGKLVGGPQCKSKDQYGHYYCYVDEATADYCNENVKDFEDFDTDGFTEDELYDLSYYGIDVEEPDELANTKENIWYPKDGEDYKIYKSFKACLNKTSKNGTDISKVSEIGNEELLENIEIKNDNPLFFTGGSKVIIEGFEDYLECQDECKRSNEEPPEKFTKCSAWSYNKNTSTCYLQNVDACCGQNENLIPNNSSISGYICPNCWSTRGVCPCKISELTKNPDNTAFASNIPKRGSLPTKDSQPQHRRRPKPKPQARSESDGKTW